MNEGSSFQVLGELRLQVHNLKLSWACGMHRLSGYGNGGCCGETRICSHHHACKQSMLYSAQLERDLGDNEGIQQQQLQISHEHAQGQGTQD